MGIPQLLIHDKRDNVGVVVVEDITAGAELLCVITEDNSVFKPEGDGTSGQLIATSDIPIGHKVALTALRTGDTVIKYGEDIGKMVGDAGVGDHVHTHNLKTKRW